MKKWSLHIGIVASVLSLNVFADALDGGKILEIEAEKARKIEDLEYQAQLIEQKAKLANAYKKLHETGGYLPGEGEVIPSAAGPSGEKNTKKSKLKELPTLKSISGHTAMFEWKGSLLRGKPGSELPGGFVVLSVNDIDGVRIKHLDNVYGLGIAWSK